MKILGLGVPELVIILLVILVIFGPKQLPKLGKAVGQTVKGLKSGMQEVQDAVKEDLDEAIPDDADAAAEAEEMATAQEQDAVVYEEPAEETQIADDAAASEEEAVRTVKRVVKKKID